MISHAKIAQIGVFRLILARIRLTLRKHAAMERIFRAVMM
jgi:hypothetical protein